MNKSIKWEHWSSVGICDWQAEHLSFVIKDCSVLKYENHSALSLCEKRVLKSTR